MYGGRAPSLCFCQCRAEKASYPQPSPLCRLRSHDIYLFLLSSIPKFHAQFVALNQPSSRTTGPEGSDSTHPQEPNLQLPRAAGPAD